MKTLRSFFILELMFCLHSSSLAGDDIEILTIKPIYESHTLKGYFMVSREVARMKKTLNYTISRCDLSMKPVKSVVEGRNLYDDVLSAACNASAFCVVYNYNGDSPSRNINNAEVEMVSYNFNDLSRLGNKRILSDYNGWQNFATIIPNNNEGFILNALMYQNQQFNGFTCYDNQLKEKWRFTKDFQYKERVFPMTYTETLDNYFYNFYARKEKMTTGKIYSGLLVNDKKDGSLIMNYELNSEGTKLIDKPALTSNGSEVAMFADYNYSEKNGNYLLKAGTDCGLMIVLLDLKSKKFQEKKISLTSPEFLSLLSESDKEYFKKKDAHLHPFRAVKIGESFFVVGETYKNNLGFDVAVNFTQRNYNLCSKKVFIAEIDKNLNLKSIVFYDKTEETGITYEEASYKILNFNDALLDMRASSDNTGFKFRYLDMTSKKTADEVSIIYANGQYKTQKKALTRKGMNWYLNALEGVPGKVIKVNYSFIHEIEVE